MARDEASTKESLHTNSTAEQPLSIKGPSSIKCRKHKSAGISYVELIIAMALFAIALLAIIPTLSQAARNMTYAQEAYIGNLQAQRLMLVVRDALADGENLTESAISYADDNFEFSFWVFGNNATEFHSKYSINADAAISGITATMSSHAQVIMTIVWGEDGQVLGRAIGMHYDNI